MKIYQGYIGALVFDNKREIYGADQKGRKIFKLDEDFKVNIIVQDTPVYNFGLAVIQNSIYYTAKENGVESVKVHVDGTTKQLVSGREYYNLIALKNSLLIGGRDSVMLVNLNGDITIVLNSIIGPFNYVCGFSCFQNILLMADCGNKRIIAIKLNENNFTQVRQFKQVDLKFGWIGGVQVAGREVLVCDRQNRSLLILKLKK